MSLSNEGDLTRSLTGGGGLARVDVADDYDVDMSLFLSILIEAILATVTELNGNGVLMKSSERRQAMNFLTP